VLDEAAVAVHLDITSHFTSAVSHAWRLNVGLCGEDVAWWDSSIKLVASEETTPPCDAIHLQQTYDCKTENIQCDSSPLITVVTAFVKKRVFFCVVSTQLQLCEQFPVKVSVFIGFSLALGMTLA